MQSREHGKLADDERKSVDAGIEYSTSVHRCIIQCEKQMKREHYKRYAILRGNMRHSSVHSSGYSRHGVGCVQHILSHAAIKHIPTGAKGISRN